MKRVFLSPSSRTPSRNSSRQGVALISVLAIVVLITALVVAFLMRAGSEKIATSHYDATSNTRVLSDTVVNLVQAIISEATTVQAGTGQNTAWASQPGAIRVFDDSSNLKKIYRLYSAPSLATETTSGSILSNDLPPNNWASLPSEWVDLNAPAIVSGMGGSNDKLLVYPILDPRNPDDPGTVTTPKVTAIMPGFSISNTVPPAPSNQPAPMPVRWLYVLQDGQIVPPQIDPSGDATIAGASASNPIMGRIAFWTDDESSKVNINTAAGSLSMRNGVLLPAPWDTPRFKIWEERMLFSENQPVKAEYQRYPGHPATTDLYGIFKALGFNMQATSNLDAYPPGMASYWTTPQPSPSIQNSTFFNILPRYASDYSSQGGSRTTTKSGVPAPINNGIAKRNRLYSSVGELLYDPQRNSNGLSRQQLESGKFFLTAHSRAPEVTLFGTPRVAMWPVDTDSTRRTTFDKLIAFCATTVGDGGVKYPYYIQRNDSRSATNDYNNIQRNRDLYAYLKNLTSRKVPGFDGKFSDKYSYAGSGSNERDQILTEIIDYIRCTNLHDNSTSSSSFKRFTDTPSNISGYSFQGQVTPLKISEGGVTTRGLGRIQTLSEIGVLVICTAQGSTTLHRNKLTTLPQSEYANPENIAGLKISPMKGSANDPAYASNLPVAQYLRNDNGTDGEIVGWNAATKTVVTGSETTPPSTADAEPFPANPTLTTTGLHGGPLDALAPGERQLQAMILLELACPMMGYDIFQLNDSSHRPAYKVNVSNIQGISISGQNPFPSRTSTSSTNAENLNGNGITDQMSTRNTVQSTGGIMGFRYLIGDKGDRANAWSGYNPYTSGTLPYRYVSNPFKIGATNSTISLEGNFTVELHVPIADGGSNPYQTFNVSFPQTLNIPVPELPKNAFSGNDGSGNPFASNIPADWWGFDYRIARSSSARTNGNASNPIMGPGAVIRGDIPVSGTWSYNTAVNVRMPTFSNQTTATFSGSDVVRTMVAKDGDYRLAAARETVTVDGSGTSPFEKGPGYDSNVRLGHLFKDQSTALGTAGVDNTGKLVEQAPYSWQFTPKVPGTLDPNKRKSWDWDSGLPAESDGAYANKPDEGNIYVNGSSPYYNREQQGSMTDIVSYFTANRIVSSPVMFGSLPSGVVENISWRTLLFRPQKGTDRPFDASGIKDHLLLDLFWMPVVEPYAISEPFSTAGKVNMNYQIVPFTYINRSSAVRAVLGSELVARVPKAAAANLTGSDPNTYYKGTPSASTSMPPGGPSVARLPLNLSETNGALRQFKEKFAAGKIFVSASEICDVYLTPDGYSWNDDDAANTSWYGNDFSMIGDNVRERPYSNLYPRLTTKSNTFTVHYKVQALKSPIGASADKWSESRGTVLGEYRGSTTLERYLNPNNSDIEDYATNFSAPSLDKYYQWRIISNNAFSP